jgi:hypothetical protein
VFQGIQFGVITQTKEQVAPYLIGGQYMAHQTNLTILVLSKLFLVV